ncbi:MAG TPA: endonuclease/exonuclease/phosphatase family protein [Pseudomonadales bacterium]|nr:endonuclease/exonuclease/phosphatase family protein [Pseudomonadales bacterium]
MRSARAARRGRVAVLGDVASYLLLVFLAAILPARGFLPADVLVVDVITSFAAQCAVVALAAALLFLWRRRWLRAAAFALLLLPDLVSAAQGWRADAARAAARPLGRVYSANLSERPENVSRAVADLHAVDADLIWLTEFPDQLDAAHALELEALEQDYPFGLSWPAADGRSLRFLSRYPVRAREVFNPKWAPGRPALRLTLDVRGVALTVFALHTHPPAAGWSLLARNETLDWVAASLAMLQGDALVIGDLNLSAFSPRFDRFVDAAGLDCDSPWTCAVATWPSWLPPLATPIDHVLTRGELVVTERTRGPRTGSDHFPVIAELAYRPLR